MERIHPLAIRVFRLPSCVSVWQRNPSPQGGWTNTPLTPGDQPNLVFYGMNAEEMRDEAYYFILPEGSKKYPHFVIDAFIEAYDFLEKEVAPDMRFDLAGLDGELWNAVRDALRNPHAMAFTHHVVVVSDDERAGGDFEIEGVRVSCLPRLSVQSLAPFLQKHSLQCSCNLCAAIEFWSFRGR